MLAVDGDALAYLHEGAKVLMVDLADATKALAQFAHSSEVVAFDFVRSQEATEQFASNGGRGSISCTLPPLVRGLLCCCLRPCWNSCAPVEHG